MERKGWLLLLLLPLDGRARVGQPRKDEEEVEEEETVALGIIISLEHAPGVADSGVSRTL